MGTTFVIFLVIAIAAIVVAKRSFNDDEATSTAEASGGSKPKGKFRFHAVAVIVGYILGGTLLYSIIAIILNGGESPDRPVLWFSQICSDVGAVGAWFLAEYLYKRREPKQNREQ